jgi:hypothetical protein
LGPLAQVWAAIEGVWALIVCGDPQNEGAVPATHRHHLDGRKDRRLDAPEFPIDFLLGAGCERLTAHLAPIGHPEQDAATLTVEHGADRLGPFRPLTRGGFELQLLGFTF